MTKLLMIVFVGLTMLTARGAGANPLVDRDVTVPAGEDGRYVSFVLQQTANVTVEVVLGADAEKGVAVAVAPLGATDRAVFDVQIDRTFTKTVRLGAGKWGIYVWNNKNIHDDATVHVRADANYGVHEL